MIGMKEKDTEERQPLQLAMLSVNGSAEDAKKKLSNLIADMAAKENEEGKGGEGQIVSPFSPESKEKLPTRDDSTVTQNPTSNEEPIELTLENVDLVLNEVRPYLIADGGNCSVAAVDKSAGVIYIQMEGACGTCPSSATTMSQGIRAILLSRIIGVNDVVQVETNKETGEIRGKELTQENIESVLENIRPVLQASGSDIFFDAIEGTRVKLKMTGGVSQWRTLAVEIAHRIQKRCPDVQGVNISEGK